MRWAQSHFSSSVTRPGLTAWLRRRRLSDMATRALAHFAARGERAAGCGSGTDSALAAGAAATALEDLLLWLISYR